MQITARSSRLIEFACLMAIVTLCAGCSRAWWRQQADADVVSAVAEKAGDFDYGDITPAPDSRLADPFDPDQSPLPPDDPQSHELMHEVDGKRGFKGWHRNGEVPSVDLEQWISSLPLDDDGNVVLTMPEAVKVARKHSREYQTEQEDLYLSALDVTFERFRFDTQFFLGNKTNETIDGRLRSGNQSKSTLNSTTGGEFRKLTATGGELVVGLANSLVWQFSGSNTDALSSVFDFSLVQPLLRFGGRARVLEQLTQRERTLLANVRQMDQFRQGFFVEVVAGRNSGDGPLRRGDVGQAGLGLIAGLPAGRSGAAPVGGYIGVLQEQQQIRNRIGNLAALRDSIIQLDALFEAGRLQNRLQVDQTRQAYYNAQSNLLSSKAGYASRVDTFKMNLGLPPSIPLTVSDPLIDRFNLIDVSLTQVQDSVNATLLDLRRLSVPPEQLGLPERRDELLALRERIDAEFAASQHDYEKLLPRVPGRVTQLLDLQRRIVEQKTAVDLELFAPERMQKRVETLGIQGPKLQADTHATLTAIAAVTDAQINAKPDDARKELIKEATKLSGYLVDVLLQRAATKLEGIGMQPTEMAEHAALEVARCNRLDWMNARANLVDSWRQIEFEGNALESDLNLVISGDIGTRGDNPIEFNGKNSRLKLGVEFDTPITRLAERNRYRESLIEYQRARRSYMLFEDQVSQSLRNTLRITDLSQINFEIRRTAVLIAISQVSLARERLTEPPKPGAGGQLVTAPISPTAARDLVSALGDLLDAQNDFLNAWVSYEVLRMVLDFELGTMRLDGDGLWIDPLHESPLPEIPLPPVPEVAALLDRESVTKLAGPIPKTSGWQPTSKLK